MKKPLDGWQRLGVVVSIAWVVGVLAVTLFEYNSFGTDCYTMGKDYICDQLLWKWVHPDYGDSRFVARYSRLVIFGVLPVAAVWFTILGTKWVREGFNRQ